MKQGRSLTVIAQELERQIQTRKDYLAPTTMLQLGPATDAEDAPLVMKGLNGAQYGIRPFAHGQIAGELEIPKRYYDRMLASAPWLLADNVNHWLQAAPKKRMVRTLDGNVRAFLSDRYRPFDNLDLAEVTLPVLHELGCEVISAELTDQRLYIKAVLRGLMADIRDSRHRGDVVQAGIIISNSEVGSGAVRVDPFAHILSCLNGAILAHNLRRYHIGKGADSDDVREVLSTEAKAADDKAFWLRVRDVVRGAFDRDLFLGNVAKIQAATGQALVTTHVEKVVEVTAIKLGILNEDRQGSILRHLIEGGDLTRWGVSQAITRASQDVDDYDEATDLERAGGKVLELPAKEWDALAHAQAA